MENIFDVGKRFDDKIYIPRMPTQLIQYLDEFLSSRKRYKSEIVTKYNILLANLLIAQRNKMPLVASRRHTNPGQSQYIDLMDFLAERNFLEMRKGFWNEDESRITRIWLKNNFIEPINKVKIEHAGASVIVRNKGIEVPPPNAREYQKIRKRMDKINEFNSGFDVKDGDGAPINTKLRRIFCNGSLKEGGRLYNTAGGWQGLPKNERDKITINGRKTMELDFHALAINMLYQLEGLEPPSEPYIFDKSNPMREIFKKVSLIVLNASSIKKARQSIAFCLFMRQYERKVLDDNEIRMAQDLINLFMSKHEPISKHFFSGVGVLLQKMDADIATIVHENGEKEQIAVLSVHDSFRVDEDETDKIEEIMVDAYESVVGRKPNGISFD